MEGAEIRIAFAPKDCERRSETIRNMATRLSPAIPKQSN
jgi:hypothetical protein